MQNVPYMEIDKNMENYIFNSRVKYFANLSLSGRESNRLEMPDSPQVRALNAFLVSGLDCIDI